MIVVACPCGAQFRAPDEFAGRRARCKSCGQTLTVPAASAAGAAAEAPPAPAAPPAAERTSLPTPDSPPRAANAAPSTPGVLDLSVFDAALAHLDDEEVAPAPATPPQVKSAATQPATPPSLLPGRPPADGIPLDQRTTVAIVPSKKPGRLYLECACGGRLSVRETSFKKRATCPHCQKKFIVPKPPHLSDADACDLPVLEVADGLSALADAGGAANANDLASELAALAPPSSTRAPHPAARTGKPTAPPAPAATPNPQAAAKVKPAAIAPSTSGGVAARTGATPASPGKRPVPIPSASGTIEIEASDDSLLSLADDDAPAIESVHVFEQKLTATPMDGPICPCCEKQLARNARFCVECGIDAKTGRSILTSEDSLDGAYIAAEAIMHKVSWIIWSGLFPIGSEAFGTRRPWMATVVFWITVATSIAFWIPYYRGTTDMRSLKQLLCWPSPSPSLTAEIIAIGYTIRPHFGDLSALEAKAEEYVEAGLSGIVATQPGIAETEAAQPNEDSGAANDDDEGEVEDTADGTEAGGDEDNTKADDGSDMDTEDDEEISTEQALEFLKSIGVDEGTATKLGEEAAVRAYSEIPLEARCFGEFRWYQLVTAVFLHAGFFHLVGNLIFFWVFASRVNALIGAPLTALLYLVTGAAASLAQLQMRPEAIPIPSLGASGAIAGMAGLYLVFFPVHKVHLVWWLRYPPNFFKLHSALFSMRGFWFVIYQFIWNDVYRLWLGWPTGVGHWAHLGGFASGFVIGIILLLSRLINARGGDILSIILGKHAWALVGKPNRAST